MTALRTALTARRLMDDSPAWSLLRAQNAPVAIAVLGEHLAGDHRERPAAELFEAVDADLTELRDTGSFELPQTAVQYCRAWLGAGFLVRRPGEAREELYALSDGALAAVRFVEELSVPRSSVTESRLSTIVERVHRLSVDTDPDVGRRIAALEAERDRINTQIAALEAGDFEVLDEQRALERILDLLSLASALPEDFARLRGSLEQINRELRTQLIEEPASRGTVLDDIFRGVDLLADSEAGKSFQAFYALVLDPERTAAVEDDIDQLLTRPFVKELTGAQRANLRRLLPGMQDAAGEIHQVMTSLSRSLRRFVQSEELATERAVSTAVRQVLAQVNTLLQDGVQPFRKLAAQLDLTGADIGSVSGLHPHNPGDSATPEEVASTETETADIDALKAVVREAEIDTAELIDTVNAVVAERGPATIGEVLAARPGTQGAASVVGLLVLGEEYGTRARELTEVVVWEPVAVPAAGARTGLNADDDAGIADDACTGMDAAAVHDVLSVRSGTVKARRARIPVVLFEGPIA